MITVVQSVPPLFIRDADIGKTLTPYEMCCNIVRASSPSKLEGVQKINNIWRVYFKDASTRLELAMKEHILIAGKNVPLYDVNPNHSSQPMYRGIPGTHVATQNDKLTIKHLPAYVEPAKDNLIMIQNDMCKSLTDIQFAQGTVSQVTSYLEKNCATEISIDNQILLQMTENLVKGKENICNEIKRYITDV